MKEIRIQITAGNVFKRVVICTVLLLFGITGMAALAAMRKPPAEARPQERAIRVEVRQAVVRDVPVSIAGHGEVRALNTVSIAPEVSGRVSRVHPGLEAGGVVEAGEVLFEIDPRNYQAACDEARATVAQLESAVLRLEKQERLDRARLGTLERSRDLARSEYERLRTLFEAHSVGTRSGVDGAERAYNTAADQADQMAQAVALYPLQIRETESRLDAARAGLALARANLARCRVAAPFRGRVKTAAVEAGQFVAPGQVTATLADDSVLEIEVPLDSRDARRWLEFDGGAASHKSAWFNGLVRQKVRIRWTEDRDNHVWTGQLDRVVAFDPATRTLTVAVRVPAAAAVAGGADALPLVDGMFCRVEIPGRVMRNVVEVPRWAVSQQDTVYVARDGRLKTVPVTVARVEEGRAYISAGLAAGDRVIVTRLVDPLENSLLETTARDAAGAPVAS